MKLLLGFLGFTAILYVGLVKLSDASCSAMWEGSGVESKYTVLSGCLIKLNDGAWIPAENYRELRK